ncbi:MAG: ABC transporter permease [Candidatus Hadarchaeales archaeon]
MEPKEDHQEGEGVTQNQVSTNPLHGLWALTHRELKKWYKEPIVLFISVIQPIIWMALFGKAMNIGGIFQNPAVPKALAEELMRSTFGTPDYFSFMAVGMLSFVTVFTSMFSGMSIVWDRRLGFLGKVLSTPVARGAILFSKIFSAVIRSLIQSGIVLLVAFLLGLRVGPSFTPLNLLGVFAALFLMCMGLSSIFLLIAIRSTRWETQMAVVNLLNLPLLFTSNALFPTSIMPDWLRLVSRVNPITYGTDAGRQLLLYQTNMSQLMLDFAFLGAFAAIFSTIGIFLSWKYLSK